MDNPSRSERSRNAALQAALTILSRDGPGRLTLDAIARESGLSKGGLMHQFPTKQAVLEALLENQVAYFEEFSSAYIAEHRGKDVHPELAAQIATSRETINKPNSIAFALLGALSQDPGLLKNTRDLDKTKVDAIRAEASDPDLALLRWSAARGLALTSMFGLCPLSATERDRLFERLLDDAAWTALQAPAKVAKPIKPINKPAKAAVTRPPRAAKSRR